MQLCGTRADAVCLGGSGGAVDTCRSHAEAATKAPGGLHGAASQRVRLPLTGG